jgi:formiminotetrahydrofolate cyclodeaminase
MQAADVERSKRFAELAQACQQAGQHAQQVAFENAALRKQLNLLWNNQVRPGHAQGSPCP